MIRELLILLFAFAWTATVFTSKAQKPSRNDERTFVVDYENDCFAKDGKPFQYIAGTMHYFRVVPEYWRDRMEKMKMAGLNALQTYIEWNSHEPEVDFYDFNGINDFEKYIKTAQDVGLLVILRIGPFIDAERDMGGLPYWLLAKNPKMRLRSSDPSYLYYVKKWMKVLLPKVKPLLYVNGGPIIMVQIENEYGSYSACDYEYTSWLRDLVRMELGKDVVLFTTDGPLDNSLRCGKIDEVFATVDFGPSADPTEYRQAQKRHQASGPFVNSEFYPGWLDHWGEPHQTKDIPPIITGMEKLIQMNASLNVYVFEGGTSFGFGSGANFDDSIAKYQVCPTSYDYDAPLTEAGDPTDKYFAIRSTIGKYRRLPPGRLPKPSPKLSLGPVSMQRLFSLFDLPETYLQSQESKYPMSFEVLGLRAGFVLYSTKILVNTTDPVKLSIKDLRDRAMVYVDLQYQGTLSRETNLYSMPLNCRYGSQLDILVENQGRVCFGDKISETKGISNVTLGNVVLSDWKHKLIFKNWSHPFNGWDAESLVASDVHVQKTAGMLPSVYVGNFKISQTLYDTFLNVDAWGKGIAILNGNILGRYWPRMGPQRTLYVPKTFLKQSPATNALILLELENAPCKTLADCTARFVKEPVIDGPTPNS